MSDILIIGGGAAGMMAAVSAADCGHRVTVFEKNEKLGKKIYITGKGRCNVTNACPVEEIFDKIVTNSKFMYSSIYAFDNAMVRDFFEKAGCGLKVERGNRVFPVSDRSCDIINALENEMKKRRVTVKLMSEVTDIITENNTAIGIVADNKKIYGDAVLIATGGYSYPSTGSSGSGHRFAAKLGHNVTKCSPALVPFTAAEEWIKKLQGLSLRNCGVKFYDGNKLVYEDFGELLFTHFGVSGPTVLSASSYVSDIIKHREIKLIIDLKPALDEKMLDDRILRDFDVIKNRSFSNSLDGLLPKSLIPVIIELSGIEPHKKVNEIRRDERRVLVKLIKNLTVTLTGLRGFNEAIITHGGINVKEINPGTMESELIKNLYFAGEVIDVDAVTGGYNLQIAWSTGYLAGLSFR